MLSERFRLVFHREQRIVSGYRLVLGKSGLKAKTSPPDGHSSGNSRRGRIDAEGYTMAQFATKLSEALREPVLDATRATDRFDLKLEWTPDEIEVKPPSANQLAVGAPEYPDIFTALQEQLGLKLESARISADVLVIDSAYKPSEN